MLTELLLLKLYHSRLQTNRKEDFQEEPQLQNIAVPMTTPGKVKQLDWTAHTFEISEMQSSQLSLTQRGDHDARKDQQRHYR